MKLCDEAIQNHLISGGKIKRRIETYEIVIHIDKNGFFFDDDGDVYYFDNSDFIASDWEVVGPEYDWDKIIKDKVLCVFSDYEDFKNSTLSTLIAKDKEFYYAENRAIYEYCKPFNPADYNIGIDLKEYEK